MSASEMIEPEAGFIAIGHAFNEGPEKDEDEDEGLDEGDDDLDEDADEFEDPDALDDLYEEMTEPPREPWVEEEGEPSPSSEDPLLDLSGGAS